MNNRTTTSTVIAETATDDVEQLAVVARADQRLERRLHCARAVRVE